MKVLFALMVFTMVSCSSSKEKSEYKTNSTIEVSDIESAYYQKWVAGIEGGGSGINFHIVFKKPLDANFKLEKVNFQSYEGVFEKISETEYVAKFNTQQNDLTLDVNPEKEYGNKAPVEHILEPNEALLYFLIKSRGKYLARSVKNVKEKPMIAYPSMERPKN